MDYGIDRNPFLFKKYFIIYFVLEAAQWGMELSY